MKGLNSLNNKAKLDSTLEESVLLFITLKYWVAEFKPNEAVRTAKTNIAVFDQMRWLLLRNIVESPQNSTEVESTES